MKKRFKQADITVPATRAEAVPVLNYHVGMAGNQSRFSS